MTGRADIASDPAAGRLAANARIVLDVSCLARPGETVLVLADRNLRRFAPALAFAAAELGAVPVIMDIAEYASSQWYRDGLVIVNGGVFVDELVGGLRDRSAADRGS